jgi:hypothetical protein
LPLGRKQGLVVVLAVHVHQVVADLAQDPHRTRPPVQPDGGPALGAQLAVDHQFPVAEVHPVGKATRSQFRGVHRGHQGDDRLGTTVADQVAFGPATQRQVHRVHQQGLARAGLARERGEARVQAQAGVLDHCQVLDRQLAHHPCSF